MYRLYMCKSYVFNKTNCINQRGCNTAAIADKDVCVYSYNEAIYIFVFTL